ncbi:transcription antitermination factor NusB [Desulfogranum marinum]|uniref:transcription antitermination factor NusB n=1 Tax=Desulfogranum marinum TaxID=453220 RepID=UPI0019634141|nr:transcription antitermination factor NusB [Desulfogranum marinum]MBM9511152.1 transcription antitermination factor NusB [Desulfogranum marinum]
MGLRRKSRELALQFLYGHDFQKCSCAPEAVAESLDVFCQVFETNKRALPYGSELVQGLCKYRDGIDELIAKHSHNWRVERMSVVDRNILRIAVYEMEYGRDVPNQVAINEALEIAKRYSVKESIAFINGILDSVQAMLVSKQ